jgi:FemAB-related protein (PEP-CTERM system-associated)
MSEMACPTVRVHRGFPSSHWDEFVAGKVEATSYHRAEWPKALAEIFGLEVYYVEAAASRHWLVGALPLIRQNSLLFGDRLVSLPFVNYGGPLAENESVRAALLDRTVELGRSLGVSQIELRDLTPPPRGWTCHTDKATLKLALPRTVDALLKGFGSKLRSQIKRAERDPYEVLVGGIERVDDFYPVFAEVMHELGTPVYPRRFFTELLRRFPTSCSIVVLRRKASSVAGAVLVHHGKKTLEIPWAATIAAEKPRATNMLLYSEVLKLGVQQGYETFDFGRSTVDSGPYRFKLQWGAQPIPLYWGLWPKRESIPARGSRSTMRTAATRLWARLPLSLANRLGPLISPGLPW